VVRNNDYPYYLFHQPQLQFLHRRTPLCGVAGHPSGKLIHQTQQHSKTFCDETFSYCWLDPAQSARRARGQEH